jgi:hypothetical protein
MLHQQQGGISGQHTTSRQSKSFPNDDSSIRTHRDVNCGEGVVVIFAEKTFSKGADPD